MTTITALDTLLTILHDRGLVNEDELHHVCADLFNDKPLTRDHLVQIFGVLPIYHLMTTRDETTVQLLREAIDALTNRDSTVDLGDWVQSARRVVGPSEVKGNG